MKKKFDAEYPFDGYKAYLRISNSEKSKSKGRKIIGLYSSKKIPKRLTMSFARYLLCVKEKRILQSHEEADHKDDDKTNDNIDNLQILSCSGNNKKRVNKYGNNKMMVELKCPGCKNNFVKEKHNTFISKGGYYATCSKKCSILMITIKKGLSKSKLKLIGKNQILRLFRTEAFTNIT